MKGLLAALESLLNERKQHPIFLVRAMKEGADVTLCAKHRAGKPNWLFTLIIHRLLLLQDEASFQPINHRHSRPSPAGRFYVAPAISTGSANSNVTPGPSFGTAQSRPP